MVNRSTDAVEQRKGRNKVQFKHGGKWAASQLTWTNAPSQPTAWHLCITKSLGPPKHRFQHHETHHLSSPYYFSLQSARYLTYAGLGSAAHRLGSAAHPRRNTSGGARYGHPEPVHAPAPARRTDRLPTPRRRAHTAGHRRAGTRLPRLCPRFLSQQWPWRWIRQPVGHHRAVRRVRQCRAQLPCQTGGLWVERVRPSLDPGG